MRKLFCLLILSKTLILSQEFSKAIEDNSFLIEEGINQEEGVVQHISTIEFGKSEQTFSFTQEWPLLSQTHQLSYTINSNNNTVFPQKVGINYRYQIDLPNPNIKFAPRFSFFSPINKNNNEQSFYQFNLPTSYRATEYFYFHLNAGSSFSINNFPESFVGGSSIWLFNETNNFLFEFIYEMNGSVNTFTLNPGLRNAVNINNLQIVTGLSFPIVFEDKIDRRILLYISFEHPF